MSSGNIYKGQQNTIFIRKEGNLTFFTSGKRVILPSSFIGGPRYMMQNYQDAMEIYKHHGYPDLFVTFTCNPKWYEITRFVQERGLYPEDRQSIQNYIGCYDKRVQRKLFF
ncbi:hypothetical protein V2J09_003864 [Rumex salicifolius]